MYVIKTTMYIILEIDRTTNMMNLAVSAWSNGFSVLGFIRLSLVNDGYISVMDRSYLTSCYLNFTHICISTHSLT